MAADTYPLGATVYYEVLGVPQSGRVCDRPIPGADGEPLFVPLKRGNSDRYNIPVDRIIKTDATTATTQDGE